MQQRWAPFQHITKGNNVLFSSLERNSMGEYRSSAAIAWQEHLVADPWTHRLPSPYSCTRAGTPCLWRLGYRGFLGPMLLLAAMYDVQNVAEALKELQWADYYV